MKFKIGTILTITHDILLTDIDSVYKILNYMLDETLYTHQLPRAAKFCKSFILSEHDNLLEWKFSSSINRNNYKKYIELAESMFGKELEISKVPSGVWTHKDPQDELEEMVPKEKILVVEIKSDDLTNNINLN